MKFLLKASAPGHNNWLTPDFCLVTITPANLKKLIRIQDKAISALQDIVGRRGFGRIVFPVDHLEFQFIEASPTFGDPELLGDDDIIRLPDDFALDAGHDRIPTGGETLFFHQTGDVWLCSQCDNGETMEAELPSDLHHPLEELTADS